MYEVCQMTLAHVAGCDANQNGKTGLVWVNVFLVGMYIYICMLRNILFAVGISIISFPYLWYKEKNVFIELKFLMNKSLSCRSYAQYIIHLSVLEYLPVRYEYGKDCYCFYKWEGSFQQTRLVSGVLNTARWVIGYDLILTPCSFQVRSQGPTSLMLSVLLCSRWNSQWGIV